MWFSFCSQTWVKRKIVTSFNTTTGQQRKRVLMFQFQWDSTDEHAFVFLLGRKTQPASGKPDSRARPPSTDLRAYPGNSERDCSFPNLRRLFCLFSTGLLWNIPFQNKFISSVRKRLQEKESNHLCNYRSHIYCFAVNFTVDLEI